MRHLFSKNALLVISIGTVLFTGMSSKSEAKTITQKNTDQDIEQAPFAPNSLSANPTINLDDENPVASGERQELAAVSSEALGEIEPISVESYLSPPRLFESSPRASTIVVQENADVALANPVNTSSQQSELFTPQNWTPEALEPNGKLSKAKSDRPWFIAQASPDPGSDSSSEPLDEQTPEDAAVDEPSDEPSDESLPLDQPLNEQTPEDAAVDEESESPERPWTFQFTPYAFIPLNVSGNSTVEGVTADVDLGLSDILDFFVFAASGRFEAWHKNRFGIIFDGIYSHLGTEEQRVLEGPRGLLRFDVEAEVNYEQAMFDLGLGYRTEMDDGDDNDQATLDGVPDGLFDIIAGVRVQYLRQTVDLDVGVSGPNRTFAFDTDLGTDDVWVEPLLSTRLRFNFSRELALTSRADFSGLGINGLSFTWRLLGGVDWMFSGDTSLSAGYSVFGIDYETGEGRDEFGIDQVQHGPFFALTFRF